MISLVVTADSKNNPAERDTAFEKMLQQFKQPFEIIYVANADCDNLDEFRKICKSNTTRQLIVTAPSTNINTQIYAALDYTNNGDVLLATMDTNIELLTDMIKHHIDGADLVFAKKQENWFKSFFVALGNMTYQTGLKLLGRGRDMCCEPRVVLLNNRSVNTIILNPTLSKALRLVNPDPERRAKIISKKEIFDNPTPEQKGSNNSFFGIGIVSLFYIVALLVIAIVFPLSNSGVYTVWIFIALIVWLILGIIGCVIVAKFTYNSRLGLPVAVNLANEPVINIQEHYFNGNNIIENTKEIKQEPKEPKKEPKKEIKKVKETKEPKEPSKQEVKDVKPEKTEKPKSLEKKETEKQTEPKTEKPKKAQSTTKSTTKPKQESTSTKRTTTKKVTKSSTTTTAKKPAISKIKSTKGVKTKK